MKIISEKCYLSMEVDNIKSYTVNVIVNDRYDFDIDVFKIDNIIDKTKTCIRWLHLTEEFESTFTESEQRDIFERVGC